ncbi:MAG: hypothetical protein R2732_05445 [Microbacteriaceae bacterium]
MSVPDLTTLTLDELREWITALNDRYVQLTAEQSTDREQRRAQISEAITDLGGLLGPTEGPPGIGDIRAVRRYDTATMGANAGLALSLAFEGLEILTSTVLDIAHVIATDV